MYNFFIKLINLNKKLYNNNINKIYLNLYKIYF